ncbi:ATP-binding protein [Acrocarpospora catenulata]|uniref:ATP-binding protein n=1 Tax=Acrocarpospora catenulata TaxID=2836182 RepID=UPI001BD96BE2|nr:GNAT family N-acetyltransferase [Acrocarpospora catenulata]
MDSPHSYWAGDLVRLRAIEASDWPYYHAFDQYSPGVRGVSALGPPKSVETYQRETRELADRGTDGDSFALGIEPLGETRLAGALATFDADPRAGSFKYGIAILQEYQRRRFATQAARLVLRYMFTERRFHKCTVEIYDFNTASLALHERLGFTREGRLPTPRQLPPAISPFVNRENSLEELDDNLAALAEPASARPAPIIISAIAGEAGVGKTALAVHWAHRVKDRFPDGDLYINLRGYDRMPQLSAEQALDTLLRYLNIPAAKIPAGLDARSALYRSAMEGKRILVVLDNAATAEQVRPLLPGSPTSMVVITSRSLLSGLVIRDGVKRMVIDVLSPEESIRLLGSIIGAARVDAEPAAALRLAEQCSYLPLAIRIVAERAVLRGYLTLSGLSAELAAERDRLDAFSSGDDELAEVRSVLSWSYRALPADAARMFRLLGMHAGSEVSLAAAAVLADTAPNQARRLLDALTGLHMIQETHEERYRFHDLLRAYAVERAQAEEPAEVRASTERRILLWYLRSCSGVYRIVLPQGRPIPFDPEDELVPPMSFSGIDDALAWCERERANLMDALRQAAEAGQDDLVWKMAVALMAFFERFSYWSDWISSHEMGLRAARRIGDRGAEAWVLILLGDAKWDMGNFPGAAVHYEDALHISRDSGDEWGEAFSLRGGALVAQSTGDYGRAIERSQAALPLLRRIGDRRGEGMALLSIAGGHAGLTEYAVAHAYYMEALQIFEELGNRWSQALCLHQIGLVRTAADDLDSAVAMFRTAVETFGELGDRRHVAVVLVDLGKAYRASGNDGRAREAWQQCLALFRDLEDPQADAVGALLADLG